MYTLKRSLRAQRLRKNDQMMSAIEQDRFDVLTQALAMYGGTAANKTIGLKFDVKPGTNSRKDYGGITTQDPDTSFSASYYAIPMR